MKQTLNLAGFSGNVHRPSRTRSLIEAVIERFAAIETGMVIQAEVFDVCDLMPELGQTLGGPVLPPKIERVIAKLSGADAVIVGSPVYKGSYTGLFKHFIDLIDPPRLAGVPVVLTATGGGDRHALVVEHQLRPLFGFFSAHTIATSIYASERDFVDGRVQSAALEQRIDAAARDLAIWIDRTRTMKPLEKV